MRYRLGIATAASLALFGVMPGPVATAARVPEVAIAQTLALGASVRTSTAAAPTDGSAGSPFCSAVTRAELDRPDIHEGRLVHVVYMVGAEATDESLDTNGTLACSALIQNEWMQGQSDREWRWDTAIVDTTGPSDPNSRVETLDVTFVRSTQPTASLDSAGDVRAELIIRGLDEPDKRYLTYVAAGGAAGGVCGDAYYPLEHHLEEVDGKFAQVYLDSVEGCGARDFGTLQTGGGGSEAIAQQELMHNDGMTPLGAPHTCMNSVPPLAHVCTGALFVLPEVDPEGRDVMFPYAHFPLRDKVLDRGHDDYFGHGLPLADLGTSLYLQPADAWGKPFVQPRASESPGADPSPPTTDPPSGSRSIDASADRGRVRAGDRVAVEGVVSSEADCAADQRVVLRRKDLDGNRRLPHVESKTDQDGAFSFRVTVRTPTRFVVVAPGTDACTRAGSAPFVVRTR